MEGGHEVDRLIWMEGMKVPLGGRVIILQVV